MAFAGSYSYCTQDTKLPLTQKMAIWKSALPEYISYLKLEVC